MLERNPKCEYDASTQIGPGVLLHTARESKQLSISDIAADLHINEHVIVDIEADHFANAPALSYMRGYLRAYARMVDLSPADVLHAFEAMGWQDVNQHFIDEPGHAELRAERSGIQKYWLLITGVLLVILLAVVLKILKVW